MPNMPNLIRPLLIVFAIALGSTAWAMESTPFNQGAFDAAQEAGKPILIEVHAPWCPTCRAQGKVLAKLWTEPRFKEFVTFRIDFDSQKDLLRHFNARVQSTLIVFRGLNEAGRLSGETDADAIATLLGKAI